MHVPSLTPGLPADSGTVEQRPPLYDTDRALTLPNLLSMLRLAGVPLVLWLSWGPAADGLARPGAGRRWLHRLA
jgi:cardiolipin synthase